MDNTEAQNEIMNAVGADTMPSLYSGNNAAGTISVQAAAQLASFGAALTDEAARSASDMMLRHEFHAAAAKVWLGIICIAKKEALDARGHYANEADRSEGFEKWRARVFGKTVTDRNLRRYMALALAFLWDAESALGSVPEDEARLKDALLRWCGERTLTQIGADIRAEAAKRKELTASENEAPKDTKPEPSAAERMAALLERFDRVLDRAQEYDTQVRAIFEESAADWSNEAAQTRLEALAKHHAELHEFYAGLFAKAKEYGARAG